MLRTLFLTLAFIFPLALAAQEDLAPPPPLPEENGELIPEPEVTIEHRKDEVVEEYRVNGQLRYVKITPSRGPAYYMVDTDGDGLLEKWDDNLDNPPINQWILLRW